MVGLQIIGLFFISLSIIFQINIISAFTLDDKLKDKNMEERAVNLFKIIKCPICSGELLSESESKIARCIRKKIRKKINDGYNDQQIILDLKNYYGNSIIIKPPIKFSTYILWLTPFLVLLAGSFMIYKYNKVINKI